MPYVLDPKEDFSNKALLIRRLVKLEHKDGQNMIEHFNNFKRFTNQVMTGEIKLDYET